MRWLLLTAAAGALAAAAPALRRTWAARARTRVLRIRPVGGPQPQR